MATKRKRADKPATEKPTEKAAIKPAVFEQKQTQYVTLKKIGGGALRIGNRIIKPGQVFKTTWDKIPAAFRNVLQIVDGVQPQATPAPERVKNVVAPVYTIQPVSEEEGSLVNIVDQNGKVINDEPLEAEEAQLLVEKL